MKRFLKIYAACLVFVEVFSFFGGYMLFDMSNGNLYRAGAAIALVLAIAGSLWASTENKVEALEKELQELKKQIHSEHTESEDTVS